MDMKEYNTTLDSPQSLQSLYDAQVAEQPSIATLDPEYHTNPTLGFEAVVITIDRNGEKKVMIPRASKSFLFQYVARQHGGGHGIGWFQRNKAEVLAKLTTGHAHNSSGYLARDNNTKVAIKEINPTSILLSVTDYKEPIRGVLLCF